MKLHKKEIQKVLELSAEQRYWYCIKKVADSGSIWGLYLEGWALAESGEEERFLPLWPAKEYAMICAEEQWSGYHAESIDIYDFLNTYIDELSTNGILPAIFYTPTDRGVLVEYGKLKSDLKQELSRVG